MNGLLLNALAKTLQIPASGSKCEFAGSAPDFGMPAHGWTKSGAVALATLATIVSGGGITGVNVTDGVLQANGKWLMTRSLGTSHFLWELNGATWTMKAAYAGISGANGTPSVALRPDGLVMLMGGVSGSAATQVYDPVGNTVASGTPTNVARNGAVGMLIALSNGIIMAYGSGAGIATTEAYDYSVPSWTPKRNVQDGGVNVLFNGRAVAIPGAKALLLHTDGRLFLHDYVADTIVKIATLSRGVGVAAGGLAFLNGYLYVLPTPVIAQGSTIQVFDYANLLEGASTHSGVSYTGSIGPLFREDPANNRIVFTGNSGSPVYSYTPTANHLIATRN